MKNWEKSHDWFWEGNIQDKIIEYMRDVEQFDHITASNTREKRVGPDILGKKGSVLRQIAVKGYPSDKYTDDFPGGKKGELKRTQPATQARHWFSEAFLEVILAKSENEALEIALGFPKFQTYMRLLERTRWAREKTELYCYLVTEDGKVELLLPAVRC
jgi:hypothetical protein